jgi:hypothetical protein
MNARSPKHHADDLLDDVLANVVPMFPGLVDYVKAVSATTEASPIFHVGAFLVMAGLSIGLRAFVAYPAPTYPNLYMVFTGRAGMSRKTTALRHGTTLAEKALGAEYVLGGAGSAEGLMDALKDQRSFVLAAYELRGLLEKARQTGMANLIPFLTEIYDVPDTYTLKTRGKPVLLTKPFLSLISSTTERWLSAVMREEDVGGGFVSRCMWLCGPEGPPISLPPPYIDQHWDAAAASVSAVGGRTFGRLALDGGAEQAWKQRYLAWRRWLADLDESATAPVARTPTHAIKIALIRACLSDRNFINEEDVWSGWTVASYAEQVVLELLDELTSSPTKRLEQRIVKYLEKNGLSSRREIQRSVCGSKITAYDFNRVWRSLVEGEVIGAGTAAGTSGMFNLKTSPQAAMNGGPS